MVISLSGSAPESADLVSASISTYVALAKHSTSKPLPALVQSVLGIKTAAQQTGVEAGT